MSRLVMRTVSKSQEVVEDLYKVLERRIVASPPGICPVDISAAFLKLCHEVAKLMPDWKARRDLLK